MLPLRACFCTTLIPRQPNGALLVQGVVDKKKVEDHASITLDDTFAVPGIILRDNIGVNS